MEIIGLAGLAQCGKSTLATDIARVAFENKMQPRMMSFAGDLKTSAATLGADKASNPDLYRKFCQDVGSCLRDPSYVPGVTGPDYWVNRTRDKLAAMDKTADHNTVVIFDDVRYMNEVGLLRKLGACLIYVDRETELPNPNAEFRHHESEMMAYRLKEDGDLRQRWFDFHVSSAGTMDEYLKRLAPFIPVWLGLENLGLPDEPWGNSRMETGGSDF